MDNDGLNVNDDRFFGMNCPFKIMPADSKHVPKGEDGRNLV